MPVDYLEEGQALTVQIIGEVDHHAANSLMSQLTQKLDTALPGSLELDMSKVTFMDSSGIAVVLRTWKRMCQLGGSMRLQNVPSYAAKVLKAAGVDKLLEMTEKE